MKLSRIFFALTLVGVTLTSIEAAKPGIQKMKINGRTVEVAGNQVLVKYKSGRGPAAVSMSHNEAINFHRVQIPAGETIESYLEKLRQDPNVEFAEPNGIVRALATPPNDPLYLNGDQYYLETGTGGIDILNAWDITMGSVTTVVAVLDTGIDLDHVDISTNLWVNPNSTTTTSGVNGATFEVDLNGNGVCDGSEQCDGNDPDDDNATDATYHGTHSAGIIAATTNNGIDIAGICRNCRVMAVKVLDSDGLGTFDSIANGITYAVDNGAEVINLSLGGETASSVMESAVNYAIQNNIVVVAAAGNIRSGQTPPCPINYPAAISDVIAVGATDSRDAITAFSCQGIQIDLVAPGFNIYSLTPGGTRFNSGTSFSAPMVSAVAGLIRSIRPSMTVADVRRFINFSADDLGSSGFDSVYGFGRLNANNALVSAESGTISTTNPADPGSTYAYPNPFNPALGNTTRISLPQGLGSTGIEIRIFRLSGEEVRTLTGTTEWDGRNDSGNVVASGLYFYYAETSNGNVQGKVTVIK